MKRALTRLKEATLALLRQGMTPRKLSACIAMGASISICPVIGVPTPLLTVLALGLRLNLALVQAINYLATPLQWLLIVPFLRLGEVLSRAERLPLSPEEIVTRIRTDPMQFFREFGSAVWHAGLGWLVCAPILYILVYVVSRPLVVRMVRRTS